MARLVALLGGRREALIAACCVGVVAGLVGAGLALVDAPEVVEARPVSQPPAGPPVLEGAWPMTEAEPVHPTAWPVADAVGDSIDLFSEPAASTPGETLDNPTWEGLDVVFAVLEERGDWLRVMVSARPNGKSAWIRAADVTRRTVPNWVQVELGARRLTVFHGDTPIMQTEVAIGRPSTPTPVGSFFVDGIVPLDPPHRAYGAGQVSVSGFSETLTSFGGGVGQIALHGTMATSLIGQETSNGCVRLDNDAIRSVMDLAPTGTPVEILP